MYHKNKATSNSNAISVLGIRRLILHIFRMKLFNIFELSLK